MPRKPLCHLSQKIDIPQPMADLVPDRITPPIYANFPIHF
jgi:hypothetical protein